MLAYELYLRNKDSPANNVKREKSVKKIYVQNGNVAIDSKTLDEYASKISEKYRILQVSLTMPLNTSNSFHLNLPDARTSTSQPNPYVEIRGSFKRTRSEYDLTLLLQKTVTDKDNLLQATFDISNDEVEIQADKDIRLRIDTQNYQLGEKKLFEEYVNAEILTKDFMFSADLFTKIAREFFSFVKSRSVELNNPRMLNFSVYVLPSDSTISYIEKEKDNNTQTNGFTDSFGNHATAYALSSTKTAKFLSFYEKAFTINCKQDTAFYQNIGIGRQSLPHIFLPADQTFRIAGLSWVFIDLSDIHQTFKQTRLGILSQLSENYQQLNSKGQTKREKSLLKIICFRTQQAKQEILIDENLTMDRMKRLFSTFDPKNIPVMAFEVLVYKDRRTVWNDYLHGIRSLLSETRIPKSHLVTSFTRLLKRYISEKEWIKRDKKREDAIDFFKRTDFCLKTLSRSDAGETDMSVSENFAYKVGTIARLYVDFKNSVDEESHSLRDILTYSKYDREKLRFVIKRLGLGLNISKAKKTNIAQLTKKVSQVMAKDEIPEDEAFNDYSYFFYKGYFLGGDGTK
jgi:hypothetical protein